MIPVVEAFHGFCAGRLCSILVASCLAGSLLTSAATPLMPDLEESSSVAPTNLPPEEPASLEDSAKEVLVEAWSAAEKFGVSGFQETVGVVYSLDPIVKSLVEAAGWESSSVNPSSSRVLESWGLEKSVRGREVVLKNPGTERGFLRLVELQGVTSKLIRPSPQTWDTGGIFDVNVRVIDIETRLEELRRQGWDAHTEPVQFSFGPFIVKEVLARGPDGITFAMIERLAPPLEDWPNLLKWSRLFNSTQIVADFDTADEFYRQKLGFLPYLEHEGASQEEGANVLGLPHNLTTKIPRRVAILSPDGKNEGSVEILSFEGATGADRSALAQPPHRGLVAIRFPVTDLDGYASALEAKGVSLVAPIQTFEIPPYGTVRLLRVRSPERALLEFFERVDGEHP